jgi:hypothetical protein
MRRETAADIKIGGPVLHPVARHVLSVVLRMGLVAGPSALLGAADYYQLPNIKRVDHDLYRTAEVAIVTRSCLHLATGEEALLKYEGPGEYTIVWEDRSTCEVLRVLLLY